MGVTDTLQKLSDDPADKNRLDKIGLLATDYIRLHIYEGKGFDPLSPATSAYRRSGKALQDTGGLRDSIAYTKSGDTVIVGTTNPYAAVQNDGATITAKKNWLYIPASGTRKLERRYGKSPSKVLSGLKNEGYSVYRIGRTVCYRKSKKANSHVAYYLKKSVVIPARKFFYLSEDEINTIAELVLPDV